MTTIVVDPAAEAANQTDPPNQVDESVPEKYRGKSVTEILEITRNLESELGRKNNEVGSLRRLTDQVLGLGTAALNQRSDNQQTRQTKTPTTTEDLLANPDKTVSEIAQQIADDRVQATEKRTANLEAQLNFDRFHRANPDFEATVLSDDFKNWANGSSYRQKLAYRAAQNDWDAADELLGLFNESKPVKETPDKPTKDPTAAAKAAGFAKRGGSSAAGVGNSNDGKKTYSRTELIDMRINKPEEFEARYTSEFLPAYKEGRVK